jgi:hypothetical protein
MPTLVISELLTAYRQQRITAEAFFTRLLQRIDQAAEHHLWITRLSAEQVMAYVAALHGKGNEDMPL